MKKIKKSHATDDDDAFCLFHGLPDDIVIEVLNKVFDLKTLCICKVVSKCFYRNVLQVEVISITSITHRKKRFWSLINSAVVKPVNLLRHKVFVSNEPSVDPVTVLFKFDSIIPSFNEFQMVKSLCVQLPLKMVVDDTYLFKWKFIFPDTIGSFIFLSPNSIQHTKGLSHANEYDQQVAEKKLSIAMDCLMDAAKMHTRLLTLIQNFPLLENVSITDLDKRGMLSVSGGRIANVRNWLINSSDDDALSCKYKSLIHCYIPSLELPVSGYKMNGVTLIVLERDDLPDGSYSFMKSDFEQDKEEVAYIEAMTEILNKHRDKMQKMDFGVE